MTPRYVLREDADEFTYQLIRDGWNIVIVDKMPRKLSEDHDFLCQTCGSMTPHRYVGYGWVCMTCAEGKVGKR